KKEEIYKLMNKEYDKKKQFKDIIKKDANLNCIINIDKIDNPDFFLNDNSIFSKALLDYNHIPIICEELEKKRKVNKIEVKNILDILLKENYKFVKKYLLKHLDLDKYLIIV